MSPSQTEAPETEVDTTSDAVSSEERQDTASSLRSLLELVHGTLPAAQFYREALRSIATTMGAPFASLEVRLGGEVIQHEVEGASRNTAFWRRNVQEFLTDTLTEGQSRARLFRSAKLKTELAFLGVPVVNADGRSIGALALVVACQGAQEVREQLTFLHCLTLVLSAYEEHRPAVESAPTETSDGAAGARALSRLAGFRSPTELAFELTNKIRNRYSCGQVALGRVRGRSVRILSISGIDNLKKRSSQVLRIQSAMEECLDRNQPIVSQGAGDEIDPSHYLLHEAWRKESGGACVASIPLATGDGGGGAILSLRRGASNPFSQREIEEVRSLVEPYAAGMGFVERANRGLLRHGLASARQGMLGWLRPGRWVRKAVYAGLAASVLFLAFGTLPHTVSAPSVLVPGRLFNASAPFDGLLREAPRIAGDEVERGDLLFRFDTTELELEKRRLEGDIEVLRLRYEAALAQDAAVETSLIDAQIRQVRARRDMVEHDIQRSSVHAPFDGLVLTGDLRDRLGDQVVQGEPLFQISPAKDWKLELEVPESQVVHLVDGLSGRFASHARPEEKHDFSIRRIRPSAELRDGVTVYVAEAAVEFERDWLLAGMEGLARVETGNRPAWWVVFHGVLDRMRLNFWL